MFKIIDSFVNLFTVNKYYQIKTGDLERLAGKWKIEEYVTERGVSRKRIIDQLIKKDVANNSRLAIIISIIALLISLFTLALK